jgi:hypothetical protein
VVGVQEADRARPLRLVPYPRPELLPFSLKSSSFLWTWARTLWLDGRRDTSGTGLRRWPLALETAARCTSDDQAIVGGEVTCGYLPPQIASNVYRLHLRWEADYLDPDVFEIRLSRTDEQSNSAAF